MRCADAPQKRVLVALASAAVGGVLGWQLLPRRAAPATALVDDRAELQALLEGRAIGTGALANDFGLVIEPMPEGDARRIFLGLHSEESVYDREVYYRHAPRLARERHLPEHPGGRWTLRTNSQGFREDEELSAEKPDLRILVIGDSHTDGTCDNQYTFANVMERLLRERDSTRSVEVINAGVASYSFYNYLGAIEKYERELDLDVFICAVFGGNDFIGTLRPTHYFQHTLMPTPGESYDERIEGFRGVAEHVGRNLGQAAYQLAFLAEFPEQANVALRAAELLTSEMARRARAFDLPLIFVYIPPAWDIQLKRYEPRAADFARALRLEEATGADGWADRWTAHVKSLGLPLLDPRPEWRAADVDLYWLGDHHINIEGHRRLAEDLLPLVEAVL